VPDLNRLVSRLPAWVVVVVALACVAGGVVLTFRPFTSVDVLVLVAGLVGIVTGVLTLVSPDERSSPAYRWLVGVGWIVLGVAVLAWPSVSVQALAIVVGVALVVNGVANIVEALTGRTDEPISEFIGGAASIVFGVLALAWSDVTVLVVAVLFGARTVLFGSSQLVALVKRWRQPAVEAAAAAAERPSRLRRGLRLGWRSVGLVVALLLLGTSVALHDEVADVPEFYDAPESAPDTPGQLLRSESIDTVPDGVDGWRILYTTTDTNDEPVVGSAFVIAKEHRPEGPRPVILWTHGTVGINRPCAPSLYDDVAASPPAGPTPEALDNGWVMVAPDYPGMGTEAVMPYLIGKGQAYSSLDALRAAYLLEDVSLDREQTVLWGHSQGGNAALWTGVLADDYAPDLTINGVAALAPASDLVPLAQRVQGAAAGTIVTAFFLTAYAGTYDDVKLDDYVRPGARVTVREAAGRCLSEPGLAVSLITASGGESLFARDLSTGPLGDRLRENTPTADMKPPLLVASGTGDEVINIAINEGWVAQQCAAGYKLDFRTYPGRTHMGVLDADSPLTDELATWTADRFAGKPAASTC
jgi:uncharacterized membrane protein HdeD (DUF308 family)/acetyl esterase/lipase